MPEKKKKNGAKSSNKSESGSDSGSSGKYRQETFRIRGEDLIAKVKELINEGNIRRLIIKDSKGRVVVEFPLTLGVVVTVLAPVLAAIGAIAALLTECTITVEREK